jgi:hypothetical protein
MSVDEWQAWMVGALVGAAILGAAYFALFGRDDCQ